jgi:hypothetical protein
MAEQTAVTTAPEKKSERLGSAKGAGAAAEGAGPGVEGEHERRGNGGGVPNTHRLGGGEKRAREALIDTTLKPM